MTELKGVLRTWGLSEENRRQYVTVETTFGVARRVFKSEPYSALTGKGEQRGVIESHAKKIRKAMEDGDFTPTAVHAGVRPRHAKSLRVEGGFATIAVEDNDTLPLTDGGHRFDALEQIRGDAARAVKAAGDDASARGKAETFLSLVDEQPITVTVLLNGNTQDDFLNLQKNKSVDPAHLFSLKVARGEDRKRAPALRLAFAVAKCLHTSQHSEFYKQIRFDSKSAAPVLVSGICSKGNSDLGTSLLGLARVGLAREAKPRPAEWLAQAVTSSVKAIRDRVPEILGERKVLTPPPEGGKHSSSMLIGLGVAMAYRMSLEDSSVPTERDLAQLVAAAEDRLDLRADAVQGPNKRVVYGEFLKHFFADLADLPKHEGVPVGLIQLLSAASCGVSPLPKKGKGRKGNDWAAVDTEAEETSDAEQEEVGVTA